MKEIRCDEDGNPVEIVEVTEGQQVRFNPVQSGTLHVYIHLQGGVEESQPQKEDASVAFWWLVAGFILAWMMVKWF